jgi:hypothetical protein
LGHKDPIERIVVNGERGLNFHRMCTHDREFNVPIVEKTAPQEPWLNPEVRTIKPPLDGDLPQTGWAEQQFILEVLKEWPCCGWKLIGVSSRP